MANNKEAVQQLERDGRDDSQPDTRPSSPAEPDLPGFLNRSQSTPSIPAPHASGLTTLLI